MPQRNRRQQGRPRRNSEFTSLLLVVGQSTAKPEIVSIHDNRPTHSSIRYGRVVGDSDICRRRSRNSVAPVVRSTPILLGYHSMK